MRVTLMHNASAGQDQHSAAELIDQIRAAGHEVIACVERRRELRRALEHETDVVAVAGGDGTVGSAARVLRGTGVPLAVIPRGTANNVAGALGVDGIGWWPRGEVRSYDVGRAHVDGRVARFIEVLGCGAFARVIHISNRIGRPVAGRLAHDLALFRDRIAHAPLKPYTILADGRDVSGVYFLIEVLNVPSLGPRLTLAPDASPSDGLFDLVLAGADDRAPLLSVVDAMLAGATPRVAVPTVRARRVRIAGHMRRYHLDGELIDRPARVITAAVEPGALRVLTPPRHA